MEAPEKIYLFENPVLDFSKLSERQSENDVEYLRRDIVKVLIHAEADNAYGAGYAYAFEEIEDALLSEVLPYFMHGGEADEVIAKLEEVMSKKTCYLPKQHV